MIVGGKGPGRRCGRDATEPECKAQCLESEASDKAIVFVYRW